MKGVINMTANQIAYQGLLERERANRASEMLNLDKLEETKFQYRDMAPFEKNFKNASAFEKYTKGGKNIGDSIRIIKLL